MKKKIYSGFKLWFDRLLSKSLWRQFSLLGIALVVIFFLSWLFLHISGCRWSDFCDKNDLKEWLLPLYLLIDTNALNNLYVNSVNGWALLVSSIIYVIGLFIFNGMIISVMTNAIERRVKDHREGRIHYLKSGHYVIMGYDDMVPSIITHIFEKDSEAFILLMSAAESEQIRERLRKVFNKKTLEHIIINYGHRMSCDYYRDIHLETSEQIYIVGKRFLPAHDAINVECVDSICRYLKQSEITARPKRITCVFEDLDTYAAFKTSEIFQDVKALKIEFIPYNFYAGWAKQVFVKRFHKDLDHPGEEIKYPAVFARKDNKGNWIGINDKDPRYVHLVFVGTTNFAVAFAMEAAHVLHFPNFRTKGVRTRITFIDKNADKEKDEFISRNRHFFEVQSYLYRDLSHNKNKEREGIRLESMFFFGRDANFLDVEFEFIKGDVLSPQVQEVISRWANDKENQYLSIFLALSNQRDNFAFGMNMPDEVYDNEIPVFIRQDRSDNFVFNLRTADEAIRNENEKNTYVRIVNGKPNSVTLGGRYANIYPFGMNETAYSADEKSLERAKLINYLYETAIYDESKFKDMLVLDAMSKEQILKEADEFWQELTVALKWSNLYNAYTLRTKIAILRSMRGLDLDDATQDLWSLSKTEVEEMANVEHNRWNVEKLLMGYRKPHKDEDKYEHKEFASDLKKNKERFIHHDIRPFKDLGSIKELDKEFARYIPWILKMTEE